MQTFVTNGTQYLCLIVHDKSWCTYIIYQQKEKQSLQLKILQLKVCGNGNITGNCISFICFIFIHLVFFFLLFFSFVFVCLFAFRKLLSHSFLVRTFAKDGSPVTKTVRNIKNL